MSTYEEERDAAKALFATATPAQLAGVQAVIDHALQHYNENGWDFVIETWERYEIFEVLLSVGCDVPMAIKEIGSRVKVVADYRADIVAEADY